MAYVWPVSLPQAPQKGFTETGGALIARTPMDSGPAKLRKRGSLPSKLTTSFVMTTTQVSTLETFIRDTIKGVSRFEFTHPRTKQTIETRIISQGDGELYTITYLAPEYWTVTLNLEILP